MVIKAEDFHWATETIQQFFLCYCCAGDEARPLPMLGRAQPLNYMTTYIPSSQQFFHMEWLRVHKNNAVYYVQFVVIYLYIMLTVNILTYLVYNTIVI
jgi:hypothetical protein